MFDRFDICEAYCLYDWDYGPTEYSGRLHRINFKPGAGISLETANENVKQIYGRLVREHNRLYVGYERLHRRHPEIGSWPGTQNMPRGESAWLQARGLYDAVLAVTS